MEVPESILEHIKTTMARGAAQQRAAEKLTAAQLRALYEKAAVRIAARIADAAEDASGMALGAIQDSLRTEMERLSARTYALTHGAQEATVRGSTAAVEAALGPLGRFLPTGMSVTSRGSYHRIWDAAVGVLQYGVDGVELSARIWQHLETSLQAMRGYIGEAMTGGTSKAELYRQLKAFLVDSHVDMRYKVWRQFFKDNPPGRGKYRSAYKNVQRVLRTETNRAYRMGMAMWSREKPWMLGLRWVLSLSHPEIDICDLYATQDVDDLGPGVYRVETVPDSAHPHCICYLDPVVDPAYLAQP